MSRLTRMRNTFAAVAGAVLLVGATTAADAYSGNIVLFDQNNGTGASIRLEGSVPDLRQLNFNDRANSIYVVAGTWELCEDANYKNDCGHYGPGMHNLGVFANSISSVRPINTDADSGSSSSKGGFVAFRNFNGDGSMHQVKGDAADLTKVAGFNDTISSIAIFDGRWQICEHKNFKGQCITLGPGVYNLNNFNDRISSVRRIGD